MERVADPKKFHSVRQWLSQGDWHSPLRTLELLCILSIAWSLMSAFPTQVTVNNLNGILKRTETLLDYNKKLMTSDNGMCIYMKPLDISAVHMHVMSHSIVIITGI